MSFKLPDLPYLQNELEPSVSERTIQFHYGKHHQTYVNKVNDLVKGTDFEDASLETIIKEADGGIYNNGAQVWNHTFYFKSFSPSGGGEPNAKLARAIKLEFDSFVKFREEFSKSAASLFGSGWVWLVSDDKGALDIIQESNAGNPLRRGLNPILTIDVWEHAYYLDYQNKRPDYIDSFWKIVDWPLVEERYAD